MTDSVAETIEVVRVSGRRTTPGALAAAAPLGMPSGKIEHHLGRPGVLEVERAGEGQAVGSVSLIWGRGSSSQLESRALTAEPDALLRVAFENGGDQGAL